MLQTGRPERLMKTYENYPFWLVAVSNLHSLAVYFLGAVIMHRLGLIWMAAYLLYIAVLELRLMGGHCVHCCYFGKVCAFGKGKLSSLFFRRGDPQKFARRQLTWKSMVPDTLVSFVPMVTGAVLMFRPFDRELFAMVAALFLLTTSGNAFIRGTLACRHCKQRELGCPAEQLFNKREK